MTDQLPDQHSLPEHFYLTAGEAGTGCLIGLLIALAIAVVWKLLSS